MKRKRLLYFIVSMISLTACAAPSLDQSTTVEILPTTITTATPTSLPTATQPAPTATITPASTSTPVAAPDQVWLDSDGLLIYSHSGNLCMKDGDADPVFLMPANSFRFDYRLFDDGQTIVLLGDDNGPGCPCKPTFSYGTQIWRVDRQTGEVAYLTSTYDTAEKVGVERLLPIWSFQKIPGSDAYLFDTAEASVGVTYSKDLYLVDENGQLTVLFEPGSGGVNYVLSPDGQHIAYVSRDDYETVPDMPYWIGLIDAGGENHRPRLITYDWIATESEWSVITRPVWRSDSDGFWIAIPPPNRFYEELPNLMTTWYVPVDGEPVQLGSFERPWGIIHEATFSPDGNYVAYIMLLLERRGLYIVQPDGSGDNLYFEGDVYGSIQWEDDTHFTFRSWDSANSKEQYYRGGIGEEPVLLETRDREGDALIPVPEEGCAP